MSNPVPETTKNQLEIQLHQLELTVRSIAERNARVELDKAWETSRYRILSISFTTWIVISLVFWTIGVDRPLINALIPTIGFYLSTQTLPFLKAWWLKKTFPGEHGKLNR